MGIDPNSAAGRDILAALADGRAVEVGRAPAPARVDTAHTESDPPPATVAPAAAIAAAFTLPVVTASEANGRDWRQRNRRTKAARAVVSEHLARHLAVLSAFAAHYAAGGAIDAVLTRLGGRRLDRMANLGAALKATEDAVCALLGVNDADPRWNCRAEQAPGGPAGVRVELALRT